jgi:hypothetical protein
VNKTVKVAPLLKMAKDAQKGGPPNQK